jgi:galactokinase
MSATLVSAYAPGRVELLGNHTDYNEGVVLGAAIDRGITVSGEKRNDDRIAISSDAMGPVEIEARALSPLTKHRWANYVVGVTSELRALGISLGGFTIQISGNLPAGCGLSSSAALELASALFLLKLHHHALPRLEIAKACQRAEHHFVGVKSGLLDQVTSLFGRANHAVFFDCRTEEVRTVPFPEDLALVIAESGKKRELASGSYNLRREETASAARALHVPALRDATPQQLNQLPDLLRGRAAHIVGENARVWRALDLLAAGDGVGFGALLNESHESSRKNFENSTAELDQLVATAKQIPGVLGARLTGGGFGGATITLCEAKRAQAIAVELASRYAAVAGFNPQVLVSKIAHGAD